MSLAKEIEDHTSRKWIRTFLAFCVLLLLFWSSGYIYFAGIKNTTPIPEKKIFQAKLWDIRNTIESEGKVTIKDEFHLDFINPGIIKEILKNEWDIVQSGEIIASLDTTYLDITIEKAQIALQSAEANYNLKKRWGTEDDIDISKKQLESSQASYESTLSQTEMDIKWAEDAYKLAKDTLENTKKQAQINELNAKNIIETSQLDLNTAEKSLSWIIVQEEEKYKNAQSKLLMEIGKRISPLENEFIDIDILFWISDENKSLNDNYEWHLGASDNMVTRYQTVEYYKKAKTDYDSLSADWKTYRQEANMRNIEDYGIRLKNIGSLITKMFWSAVDTMNNSATSSMFTQATLDAYLLKFEKSYTVRQSDNSSFALILQATQEAKTSMDLKINSTRDTITLLKQKIKIGESNLQKVILENEIAIKLAEQKIGLAKSAWDNSLVKKTTALTKEKSQIEISKSLLESKKWADSMELEPLAIAVMTAQKNIEEAQKKKEDSYLRSPIDGKIVTISWDVGESTSWLKESFATIINSQILFIESYVAEEDIVRVKVWQSASIWYDAIEWLTMTGEVIYVSDKATVDTNGVVSYKTQILFSSNDPRVKEWMSSTVEFITKEVKNVLIIPVQSVKTIDKKPSVMLENWTYIPVITWFTDGKMVEVITGIKKWDTLFY